MHLPKAAALLAAIALLGLMACASTKTSRTEVFNGIQFHYRVAWKLSGGQKTDLLRLAAECGMTDIDKVEAGYLAPSSLIGIQVKGTDVINGRHGSYRTLHVHFKGWNPGDLIPHHSKKEVGAFYLVSDSLSEFTILYAEGKEFRVRMSDSIPIAVADEILTKFLRKEIDWGFYERSFDRDLALGAKPTSIQFKKDATYSITFWREYSATVYHFERDAKTGAIRVTGTGSIVV